MRAQDSSPNSRWRDYSPTERTNVAVYDLVEALNIRARSIADAVDTKNFELATELSQSDSPLKILNDVFKLSAIPIEISLRDNEELVASKLGSEKYSIAELSDGERNALLIAASVLTARSSTLIIVDEPERHLHRSISSQLLSLLFRRRADCAFVVSTHDVMLPLDISNAQTLLLRTCSRDSHSNITWDVDVLTPPLQLDARLVGDILGARRNILFVEGTHQSLDLPLYSLLFPRTTVVPKASCRDVENAVIGIRDAQGLHWVRAFGIVDGDGRPQEEIERLTARGIHALSSFSVESIYYHPGIQEKIAKRQADVLGDDPIIRLSNAKEAALRSLVTHKQRLCARVSEKSVRESILREMPGHKEISLGTPVKITVDVQKMLCDEEATFDAAVSNSDLGKLIARYPVRDTPALGEIAKLLGFQTRVQYEASARKLLLDDHDVLKTVRDFFGKLAMELS